jgi:hypothetical protein
MDLAEAYIAKQDRTLAQHLRYAPSLRQRNQEARPLLALSMGLDTPAMGGEYGLRVYMDGSILPERSGP